MEGLGRRLLLISKGDELTFNGFMNRYSKRLYYHASGILSSKEMAEEVVDDVFFETWKLRKTLLEIVSMPSWSNTTVYRKSISYSRKEAKGNQEISFEELQDFSFPGMQTPVDDMLSREEIRRLNEAINSLPSKCKHVFFLARLERMPYAGIAHMLQTPLPTVNYHIGYAINTLRKRLVNGRLEKNSTKRKKIEFKPVDKSNLCVLIIRRELLMRR